MPMCVDCVYDKWYTKYRKKCIRFADMRGGRLKGDDVMQWYEQIENVLKSGETYSHKELLDELRTMKPDLSESTYHWSISSLVREGKLRRLGYDAYSCSDSFPKKEYHPLYSDLSLELINLINGKYPHVMFTVFETVMMNEFLNHLIAQNTVFIQAEKECSIFVFRFLQEKGYQNLMYKPGINDFDLYWSRDGIVVTDLISEAPLRTDEPHTIMLEKMLVDMIADKLISVTYSKAELPDVLEQAQSRYYLDRIRLFRYARRRNREKELKQYLERSNMENAST